MALTCRLTVLLLLLALSVSGGCRPQDTAPGTRGGSLDGDVVSTDTGLTQLDAALDSVFALALGVADGVVDREEALAGLRSGQQEWIRRRDACSAEDDAGGCLRSEYQRRTAELVARWMLQPASGVVFWACEGNPANEFVTTFFDTEPPSARIERGDRTEVALGAPSASGSRYETRSGSSFWISGDSALADWPRGTTLSCRVGEPR